jgi:phenylacetate-CoA ligase
LLWGKDIYEKPTLQKLKHSIHLRLLRHKHFVNYDLSNNRLKRLCELVDIYRPKVLISFTTSVEIFARYVLDTGWRPKQPLEAIVVGAENLFEAQRAIIEEAFDCKVFESYGSREFMLIAMECEEHNGLHVSSENLMVEILRDNQPVPPWESGNVVITDLHNYAQPFIRYQNDDLATWAGHGCACGRGLPLIQSIDGRCLDIIRGVDGRALERGFFPAFVEGISRYPPLPGSAKRG